MQGLQEKNDLQNNHYPSYEKKMKIREGNRDSFRRLDAKIYDSETLDSKNIGPKTPRRQENAV